MNILSYISCLSVTGSLLPDNLLPYLFFVTQDLFQKGTKRMDISEESFTGRIETIYKMHALGNVCGYACSATIETAKRKYEVTYLCKKVTPELLEVLKADLGRHLERGTNALAFSSN